MHNLFVYGSLLNKEVSGYFIDDSITQCKALLCAYQCVFVSGYEYPALKESHQHEVNGILLKGLTSEQLKSIDEFEGAYYERKAITVLIDNKEHFVCECYMLKAQYGSLLSDVEWNNEEFRKQYLQQFLEKHIY